MNDNGARPGPVGTVGHGRRILLCLDRSVRAECTVPYAVGLAKALDGLVTVVSVLEPRAERPGAPTNDVIDWEISRQEAQAYLERVQGDLAHSLSKPVDVRLEQGKPSDRILELIRELASDITILASVGGGQGSLSSLGSTVQQIVTGARSSLLIVHPSSPPLATFAPRRILVPLDGSMRAESVLPTAARIAKFVKGELLLVHSIEEPISSEILQDGADLQVARDLAGRLEAASTRYLDRLKSQVTREGISVQTLVVRHSNEHESVLAIAQADRTDLVVLSAHGSASDSRRTFGSVTVCLLAHSTVPLLVLQDLPEHAPEHVPVMDGKQAPPMRATYSLEST